MSDSVTRADCAAALTALRVQAPLVQCLTNIVVANVTANVLLAAGASPAMVDNPREAAAFASVASGVLVNLGTPYEETAAAMLEAVRGAEAEGTPWVLDPVGAGGLPWRTEVARQVLTAGTPAIIRGNASEIIGLAGGAGGRGADTTDSPEAASADAAGLAREHGCIVAVSGEVDLITDGARTIRVHGGHPFLTRVTGVGCSLGGLMAAYAAVSRDALVAATAATVHLCAAGEDAARESAGPGTFASRLVDSIFFMTPQRIAQVRLA